jgi:hypothetical protein
MDDQVLRGMARWPNVPAVYGWLALDRRGNWLLQGDSIANPVLTEYIGRNYERDAEGSWFFQNGPQRVYLELAAQRPLELETHTGQRVTALSGAWIDETGALLVDTEHGVGVVHDRDLETVLPALIDAKGAPLSEDALEEAIARLQGGEPAAAWLQLGASNVRLEPIRSDAVPARFGFIARPEARGSRTDVAAAH